MDRFVKFLNFWFPVAAYSGIIFTISSFSKVPNALGAVNFDKLWHVAEYMPFGFFLTRGIAKQWSFARSVLWILVLTGVVLFGISDEYHQSFVPGRYSSLLDIVADAIGGMMGCAVYFWLDKAGGLFTRSLN